MKTLLKPRTRTNRTVSTPMAEVMTDRKTTKNKFNILYYLIAVICITAFFVHEFLPQNSKAYEEAVSSHKKVKAERTKALNILKKNAEGTGDFINYQKQKTLTDKAWNEFLVVEEKEMFLGFNNLQQFVGEFGWAFGLFIYGLFNLILALYKTKLIRGEIALHLSLLFVSLYYISWSLQQFLPDYSKAAYVLYCIFTTCLILFSVNSLINLRKKSVDSLYFIIKNLMSFIFNNTKKDSEEKMWILLKKINNERKQN